MTARFGSAATGASPALPAPMRLAVFSPPLPPGVAAGLAQPLALSLNAGCAATAPARLPLSICDMKKPIIIGPTNECPAWVRCCTHWSAG